jgi:hypothetical protein
LVEGFPIFCFEVSLFQSTNLSEKHILSKVVLHFSTPISCPHRLNWYFPVYFFYYLYSVSFLSTPKYTIEWTLQPFMMNLLNWLSLNCILIYVLYLSPEYACLVEVKCWYSYLQTKKQLKIIPMSMGCESIRLKLSFFYTPNIYKLNLGKD